jgi:anti-anti-sigma factor
MGSAPFTARVLPGTVETTIALSGELDIATVSILEEHLVRIEADGVATIVIDLVEVTFIESMGLRACLDARKRARQDNRELLFFGAKPELRRVFELAGAESILESKKIAILYPGASLDPTEGKHR